MSSDHEEKKHEPPAENPDDAGPHNPPASLPSASPSSASAADNADAAATECAMDVSCDDIRHGGNINEKAARDESPGRSQVQQHQQQAMAANHPAEVAVESATPPRLKSALKKGTAPTESSRDEDPISDVPNIARICGRSASSCGYCRGSRTWVLGVKEGQTNERHQDTTSTAKGDSTKRSDEVSNELQAKGQAQEKTTANFDESKAVDMETDDNDSKDDNDDDSPSDETASVSYGLIFASLSPTCYQQLLDTGWRRSGNHLYKPDNFASCCPALSIRLNVQRYRASKSQRRVEKRLRRYLGGGEGGISDLGDAKVDDEQKEKNGGHIKTAKGASGRSDGDILIPEEFLSSLQSKTFEAVRSYNSTPSSDSMTNGDDAAFSKMCRFKLVKNIPKVALNSLQTAVTIPSGGRIAAVSTTACAAIGGRSKGKIDTTSLAEHVAAKLDDWKTNRISENGLTVLGVKTEKGGRVTVYLCVPSKESSSTNGGSKAASMDVDTFDAGKAPALQRQESQGISAVAEFLRKARLEMPESYRQGQDHAPLIGRRDHHVLTVRSVPSQISASQPEVHRLFAKYQTQIHGDKDCFAPVSGDITAASKSAKCSSSDDDGGDLDASLSDDEDGDDDEPTWQRDIYDVDKVYAHLNSRTRMRIKKGYVNFHRFLCETPLPLVQSDGNDDGRFQVDEEGYDTRIPFGSYHQQYRIDGILIAVGVVDILPHCLSSVYAFYDPDLSRHLELGKYTALREIEWVKRACVHRRELTHYYLGYYIRSCIKMVYKAEYKPSELLCPTTNRWIDFEVARKVLDEHSPVRQCCTLSRDSKEKVKDEDDERHSNRSSLRRHSMYTEQHKSALLDSMLLDIGSVGGHDTPPITVSMLNPEGRSMVDPLIKEFIDEVGFDVSRRCIIRLN